uniref:CAZy families GT4 protein n=1 Tax=uncultured Methylobacterium sp. TaxID=157278 RepID=A0A060CLE4_9HYPH|nr:CAZy families GT4 protein [uncultured Methylobacterium sp.]
MKKKILAIHQGHELYGSDRSFITTIKILKENYSDIQLKIIIPKEGPILEELIRFGDEIVIEDIGVVALNKAKKYPFRFLIKVIKASFKAKNKLKMQILFILIL